MVGVVQRRDTGRPELVYGRRCKRGEEEHEVMVAQAEVLLGWRIERGAKVGKTEADGVARVGENLVYVEVDNSGKMDAKQMRAKWKRYAGLEDAFIAVIAAKEGRMQKLREGAEAVKDLAFFTTFERLGLLVEPWVDFYGNKVKL